MSLSLPPENAARPTPTPKKRRKRNETSKEIAGDSALNRASIDPSEDQDGIKASANESETRRHDGNVPPVRRRHRTSTNTISDQIAAQDSSFNLQRKSFWSARREILTLRYGERLLGIEQDRSATSTNTLSSFEMVSSRLCHMAGHYLSGGFDVLLRDDGIGSNVLYPNSWTPDTIMFSTFWEQGSTYQCLEGGHIPRSANCCSGSSWTEL